MTWAGEPRSAADPPKNLLAFVLLLAMVGLAPWPLGSNRQWAWALLELGAYGLLAYLCIRQLLRPQPLPASLRDALPALAMLGAWLLLQLIQCVPFPTAVVFWVMPNETRLALAAGSREGYATLGLAPGDGLTQLLKNGAYCALLTATLWLAGSRKRALVLMHSLLLCGGLNAIYGLIVLFSPQGVDIWGKREFEIGWAVGSYANRNHFAGLMAMCVPVGLGLAYWRFSALPRQDARGTRALDFVFGPGGGVLFLLVICMAALLLSGSRGGVVALCVGCGLAGLILVSQPTARKQSRPLIWLMLVVAGLTLIWVGTGVVGERLEEIGLASNRIALNEAIWPMARASPLIGLGGGSFESVFPHFKAAVFGQPNIGTVYTHAHNDFLEALVEYGVVGCALLGAGLTTLLFRGVTALRKRNDRLAQSTAFACVGATVTLLVQGLVDFNFHIPANASIWFVLLGCGHICMGLPRPARQPSRRARGV